MLGGEDAALHSGLQMQCAGDGLSDSGNNTDINYGEGRSKLQGQGVGGEGKGTLPLEHICFIISRSIILL